VKIVFSIFFYFSFYFIVVAQSDTTNKELYTNDYKFNEGIYISFEQVKLNKPIPKVRLITQLSIDNDDFFEEVVKFDKIYFFDDYGIKQEISIENIWGYCKNNALYINCNNEFNRITIIGSVFHFVANTKVYHDRFSDPFYDYNSLGFSSYQTTELREYIFDFETGKIMDFSIESVETILKRKNNLYDEFMSLSKRKKRQLMFYYIRKYNEATPLYLAKPEY